LTSDSAASRRPRWVLWALLLLLVGVAGWHALGLYTSTRQTAPGLVLPDVGAHGGDLSQSPFAHSRPTSGPDSPAGVLANEGLAEFKGEPLGVAPPTGMVRTGGFQRRFGGELHQQATYRLGGPAQPSVDHYRAALTAKGFRVLKDTPGRDGLRTVVFWSQDGRRVVLTAGEGRLTVTAISPVK